MPFDCDSPFTRRTLQPVGLSLMSGPVLHAASAVEQARAAGFGPVLLARAVAFAPGTPLLVPVTPADELCQRLGAAR